MGFHRRPLFTFDKPNTRKDFETAITSVVGVRSDAAANELLRYRWSMLVELRSTGQQTVIPPSIRPSGEEVYWQQRGDAAIVQGPQLLRSVAHLAAASILVRHWANRGSRHETALAPTCLRDVATLLDSFPYDL